AIAQDGPRVARTSTDVEPGELVGTPRRAIEAAEDVHERAFAGAAGANDGNELALLDLQIELPKRTDHAGARLVVFREILAPDEDVHRRMTSHTALRSEEALLLLLFLVVDLVGDELRPRNDAVRDLGVDSVGHADVDDLRFGLFVTRLVVGEDVDAAR